MYQTFSKTFVDDMVHKFNKKQVKGHAYHTFWCRKVERKITYGLYPVKGSENIPFQILNPFPWLTDLQSGRVYFQILLLYFRLLFLCFGSSPFIYVSHGINHFQAFFCVRLFSTCSTNTIIKTKKSMVPMLTTSFLNHSFRQEHASHCLYIHHRKVKCQCFPRPLSPALNHPQPLMAHVFQELTFVLFSSQ